jgi:hypothetical protein
MSRAEAEEAVIHANDMNLRGVVVDFLGDAEEAFPEADFAGLKPAVRIARKAALGAQRAGQVVRRILDLVASGVDPVVRALIGIGAAIITGIVQLIYECHKAAVKRRRRRIARGLPVRKMRPRKVLIAV